MTEVPYSRTSEQPEPENPLALPLVAAACFMFFLLFIVSVAMFAVKDALRAEPPQLPWTFFLIVLGGTWLYTLAEFAILHHFSPKGFWPQDAKQWLQRLSPISVFLPAPFALVLLTPVNVVIGIGGFAIMLSVIAMLVPVLLSLGNWAQDAGNRVAETVKLRPVEKSSLPRSVRSYFDAHTDDLNRLGFERLGDYRLKERSPMYARFFLNRDSDTFAEISHTKILMIPLRAVCFFSLTPNGQYLESSNVRWCRRRQTRYFELLVLPHVGTREVFERHQARLRELDQGQSRRCVAADLEPLIHYGNKRLHELMIADGVAGVNPYADFDESVLVPRAPAPVEETVDLVAVES